MAKVVNTVLRYQPVAALPAVGSSEKGDTVVLSADGVPYVFNGSAWVGMGAGGSGSFVIYEATLAITPAKFGEADVIVSLPSVVPTTKCLCQPVPNNEFDAGDLEGIAVVPTPGAGKITFTVLVANGGPIAGNLRVRFVLYGTAFDPATLPLSGWFRSNYTGSPWSGVASAGSSGSKTLTEATNPPAVGSSSGGYTPASFNGTNQFLAQPSGTLADYVAAGSGTIAALINPVSIAGGSATGYDNPAIFSETGGNLSLGLGDATNNKAVAYMFDGGNKQAKVSISPSQWSFLFMTWDGANLKLSINDGTVSDSLACGNVPGLTSTVRMGRNYQNAFANALVHEMFTAPTALSNADRDNLRSYLNARYSGISV